MGKTVVVACGLSVGVFALGLKDFGKHTETLKLRGLDPEATYSIKEINCGERLHLARRVEDAVPQSATGRDLMERGLAVMLSGDYDSAVFEVRRVCGGGCGASEAER